MNAQSQPRHDKWQPLALLLGGIAVALVIVFRLMPYSYRGCNFVPIGAAFLFFGSRMRPGFWYLVPFAAMVGTDLWFGETMGGEFPIFNYVGYVLYLLLGWVMLRHSESPIRIPLVAVAGSVQFFLISNFSVWLSHALHPEQYTGSSLLYPPTFAGLLDCFEKGLPFYRGTYLSDMFFTCAFLAAYALLSRAYFPAERIVPATVSEAHS